MSSNTSIVAPACALQRSGAATSCMSVVKLLTIRSTGLHTTVLLATKKEHLSEGLLLAPMNGDCQKKMETIFKSQKKLVNSLQLSKQAS